MPGENVICSAKWGTSTPLWRKAVSLWLPQPARRMCLEGSVRHPQQQPPLRHKGLQAEQKQDVGPTCLTLQDPSYSPGEHLVSSLQDILGRISHLIYVRSGSTSGFRRSDKGAFKPSGSDTQLKVWKLGSFSMSTWQTSDKDSWRTNWRVEWNGLRWKKKLKSEWCSSLCISE